MEYFFYIIKIFRIHRSCVLHAVKIILIVPAEIAAASSLNADSVDNNVPHNKSICLLAFNYLFVIIILKNATGLRRF